MSDYIFLAISGVKLNEKGRRVGDSHPRSRYSDHDVELILQLKAEGFSVRSIAKMMEMPFSTVGAICSGRARCQVPFVIKECKKKKEQS